MTRRPLERRMRSVEEILSDQPVSVPALDDLYRKFLATGQLPEHRDSAWQVLRRALCARRDGGVWPQTPGKPLAGPPRERVFREAVHSNPVARDVARSVIRVLVDAGYDPSDPEFIPSDYPMPDFGSVALHTLGWPDALVKPPYEAQMQRVMAQHAQFLQIARQRSEWWFGQAARALASFLTEGVIPEDEKLRFFALTIGEMFALNGHYFGRGGEDLIAAFAAVAEATGAERDAALRTLGELQARYERGR